VGPPNGDDPAETGSSEELAPTTDVSEPERTSGPRRKGRSWLKRDRYALLHIRREHNLRPTEAWILSALVDAADIESHVWEGTFWDLAADTGSGRKTAAAAVTLFEELRLIEVLKDFGSNSRGVLRVLIYERVVLPTYARGSASSDANGSASYSRRKRVKSASGDANPCIVTSTNARPVGIMGSREKETTNEEKTRALGDFLENTAKARQQRLAQETDNDA
jgi:hypothetical protein